MSDLTLENVEDKLAAIIDDPQGSYTMAGTSFTWTDYYNFLRSLRADLLKTQADNDAREADISIVSFDLDVDVMGNDNGQVIS